ncbi:helix-turn-helix domain-containing protein [Mucilaginibacter aquatilis]|uniref:Helix-turn-helix domain-containing protein n=1 Tax=Mucilaginibacter aquatilis TaxID=1517760 RepID=A0A6I4I8P4_9SPHI|nr:helix-turn-helix domain-containing protein [Mucilaginibacter aquatilis]MVN91501.1 helix-turn-helix domain-containing protein [Mucilaginibacter aquatilis]
MPIELFHHILKQSHLGEVKNSLGKAHKALFIENSYRITATDFNKNRLAFNDGTPTIAFFDSSNSYIKVSQKDRSYTIHSAWLTSQYLEEVYFDELAETDSLLIIRFNPVLFYQAFGVTPATLRKQPVWSLAASLGTRGAQLLKAVEGGSSTNQKLEAIEGFMQKLNAITIPNKILEDVLGIVMLYKGQVSVDHLSKKTRVNYKWLERNFKNYIGLTPKEYIRLQRFMHAYLHLNNSHDGNSLFATAIQHGYYDTSHLQKELKLFTGKLQP